MSSQSRAQFGANAEPLHLQSRLKHMEAEEAGLSERIVLERCSRVLELQGEMAGMVHRRSMGQGNGPPLDGIREELQSIADVLRMKGDPASASRIEKVILQFNGSAA